MLLNTAPLLRSASGRVGLLALLLAGAVILTALAFEHLGGYSPCPLCLQQRYSYYAAIPALLLALGLLSAGRKGAASALFALVALVFIANAGLGAYHAGAEWKFWPGPDTCGGSQPLSQGAGGLFKDLANTRVIRCDEAAGRFFGLSFAGWNVIASILLAVGAAYAGVKAWRRQGSG
ncbi:MAG: disulfide bond formation protein B [Hyphomicrobiaceae bacterium]|nr:disulfide bond formation protein B [Hyphomicrobiaceae bacterium]